MGFLCSNVISKSFKILEESDFIPEEKQQNEDSSSNNLTSKIHDDKSSQSFNIQVESQNNHESKDSSNKKDTLFRRVIENGFDGITTNPNYKLLALLIILLINLSLFFVVGNIGKIFLRDSGILS